MLYALHIFVLTMVAFMVLDCASVDHGREAEPTCLSRFDFDYKVLSKFVALDTELTKTREIQEKLLSELERADRRQTELQDKIDRQQEEIKDLKEDRPDLKPGNVGDTYIRWGRTSCPGNGTELVYEGFAGGSHYEATGAAVNRLCLTKTPTWNKFEDTPQTGAHVYGAEYELDIRSSGLFYGISNLDDKDVPCAVCHTTRTSTIMIPGRNTCMDGWTLEYHGYLSAGRSDHKAASEFVCLDGEPEIIPTPSVKNENGILFYLAEGRCGTLQCPPYVNGRELTCAVCSK